MGGFLEGDVERTGSSYTAMIAGNYSSSRYYTTDYHKPLTLRKTLVKVMAENQDIEQGGIHVDSGRKAY